MWFSMRWRWQEQKPKQYHRNHRHQGAVSNNNKRSTTRTSRTTSSERGDLAKDPADDQRRIHVWQCISSHNTRSDAGSNAAAHTKGIRKKGTVATNFILDSIESEYIGAGGGGRAAAV